MDYSVTSLNIYGRNLTKLPDDIHLYNHLNDLDCGNNLLTVLPDNLPDSIHYIICDYNHITILPNKLPKNIKKIDCSNNRLISLPENMNSYCDLMNLDCSNNQLISLPDLPNSLKYLDCNFNNISILPETLPESIKFLNLSNNKLTFLPFTLPASPFITCKNNPFSNVLDYQITIETLDKYFKEDHPERFNFILK
jgi:Leucine-rich repeat (LRR) protein